MSEMNKEITEAGYGTYKVKFTSRKFKEVFPFTGKGKITFESDEILLHGYLERKSKLWLNAILILPLLGLSFFLIVFVLYSRVDPGSLTNLDVNIQLILSFGLFWIFLKIINPKSNISVKRISIRQIQKTEDGKTIRFSAIYPGTEKEGTIMIEFKSTETANKFIDELSGKIPPKVISMYDSISEKEKSIYSSLTENEKMEVDRFIAFGLKSGDKLVINEKSRKIDRFDENEWSKILENSEQKEWIIISEK